MKEEEVLKYGHIVECGRQDLVGKYVGWTAQIVESKFQAARGGILFIDEAYSLVEDNRTYGAEAINTIVQEMENYRDEVIVILQDIRRRCRSFWSRMRSCKPHCLSPEFPGLLTGRTDADSGSDAGKIGIPDGRKEQGKNAFPSAPMHAGKKITVMDGLSETCWITLSCARQTA